MLQIITDEYAEVLETNKFVPCISLIMPFEPKMTTKALLSQQMKTALYKIDAALAENYPEEKSIPVMEKLLKVIDDLNYHTHKKSIAVFVSPQIEKVYYLDIPVEEQITIDDSFEIRDLIYNKREIHEYLVAVLGNKCSKIYHGNANTFIPLILNTPDNISSLKADTDGTITDFIDADTAKDGLLDRFLKYTDNGISLLLQAYKLPLFVMAGEKITIHFKAITHNANHVFEYIQGDFEGKTEKELQKIMQPYVADWKKIIQTDLLKQVDEAVDHNKIAIGMNEVWKAASQLKGKMLIVEKNFICPPTNYSVTDGILTNNETSNKAFYIKDAIDDLIEKVLAGGGNVEFVDKGLLANYNKIALIEY